MQMLLRTGNRQEAYSLDNKAGPRGRDRQKRWGPKVKTGCFTCRIRRVKCDEEKPACRRCKSTGRACDGYASPPRNSNSPSKEASDASKAMSYLLGPRTQSGSPEEVEAFHFFATVTAKDMFCDTFPMIKNLLRVSHDEPIIRHAIIAMGSMHRAYIATDPKRIVVTASEGLWDRVSTKYNDPKLGSQTKADMENPQIRFALKQRHQSISQFINLTKHSSSKPQTSRGKQSTAKSTGKDHMAQRTRQYVNNAIGLTVSLLYTWLAMLQGHFPELFFHLVNGLKILAAVQSTNFLGSEVIKDFATRSTVLSCPLLVQSVAPVLRRIASYARTMPGMDDTSIAAILDNTKSTSAAVDLQESMMEYTESFVASLSTWFSNLETGPSHGLLATMSKPQSMERHDNSQLQDNSHDEEAQGSQSSLEKTIEKLNDLERRFAVIKPKLEENDTNAGVSYEMKAAFSLLEMERALASGTLYMMQETEATKESSNLRSNRHFQLVLEKAMEFLEVDETILPTLVANLDSDFPNHSVSSREHPDHTVFSAAPSFSPILAVVPKLFAIAYYCRNMDLRRKAVAILLYYPRRDGFWDSRIAGIVALEMIRLEEEAEHVTIDNHGDGDERFHMNEEDDDNNSTSDQSEPMPANASSRVNQISLKFLGPRTMLMSFRLGATSDSSSRNVERVLNW